jgi:hypothetical protein
MFIERLLPSDGAEGMSAPFPIMTTHMINIAEGHMVLNMSTFLPNLCSMNKHEQNAHDHTVYWQSHYNRKYPGDQPSTGSKILVSSILGTQLISCLPRRKRYTPPLSLLAEYPLDTELFMNPGIALLSAVLLYPTAVGGDEAGGLKNPDPVDTHLTRSSPAPIGKPGLTATYRHESSGTIRGSVVQTLTLALGPLEGKRGRQFQWLHLHAEKANGERFSVWILTDGYPPADVTAAHGTTARYIFQEGTSQALEFRDQFSGEAVLPPLGGWSHLWPSTLNHQSPDSLFVEKTHYLGNAYRLERIEESKTTSPPKNIRIIELLPDVLIGIPHNTRQKDETRRYDDSDYDLIRLTKNDFEEMIEAGMNCLRVDKEQAGWISRRNVFYWGIGGNQVNYPECLYRSNYLGPVLFFDEPAVCTRDHIIRPRLMKEQEFRKIITPQIVLEEFRKYFHEAKYQGAPTALLRGLAARPDVDIGEMAFFQQNLYTWETMVSSALYQLGEGNSRPPSAMVFEPPGRLGTRRTLPEMNMAYLCQIPVDDPKNFISIIYGFLRGAARLTDKEWGTSIYGQVDRADAPWYLTHAYDLGAQHFFFWDSARLACVPYSECLALTKHLRAHAESHPHRDLQKLKRAAEVAILLPPGYNLGHVYMGRGNLWGLGELNLERVNREGVTYRTVMGNFFTEIERCIRRGVAYDLLWDLEEHPPADYREIIRVKENGKVEVIVNGKITLHDGPRIPARPGGDPPQLTVELSTATGKAPLTITARAVLVEGSSPVYYTLGANSTGIYRNVKVLWELYGPGQEDYRFVLSEHREPRILEDGTRTNVEVQFTIRQPGRYRLRAATVDLAGRSTVVWKNIFVENG